MKHACACCGMFEDEDDILVCCQGPDCSLRSANYEFPGVFHGRCAAALAHSGGARWQECPRCPPTAFRAKPGTVISAIEDVDGSEEKYLCSMTQLEEENWAARISSSGRWRWTRKRIGIRAAWEEKLQEKLREARRRLVAALPVGASAEKKTETLREMQANLKAEEEEFRKLLNKGLASLELDLRFLSRRIEW